jgi:coenzyme F420-0:L-glutamate ligase/coenzyme F420-1:gamma-L-glutamate ligase
MSERATRLTVDALAGLPEIEPGADLAGLLVSALAAARIRLEAYDILVVAQKIVSKAEGRYLDLASLTPSPRALELAGVTGKDARLVEAVLSQSREVLRAKPNVLVVETLHGIVMANAGIDRSNLADGGSEQRVLLLPADPDASAARLRDRLLASTGVGVGVVVSDSVGRAWRLGTTGLAIGAAGVPALWDRRGEADRKGRRLEVTEVAFADAVAGMAVLAMGEGAESTPAALVRGLAWTAPEQPASALLRPRGLDMFR